MKVVVLYHPKSDHGGIVADYADEFERYKKKTIELVSLESLEGADLAQLYAVTQYPTVLVMTDTGAMVRMWQGLPLPLMDELSYYIAEPVAIAKRQGRTLQPLTA